jgi:hypothetical protein
MGRSIVRPMSFFWRGRKTPLKKFDFLRRQVGHKGACPLVPYYCRPPHFWRPEGVLFLNFAAGAKKAGKNWNSSKQRE